MVVILTPIVLMVVGIPGIIINCPNIPISVISPHGDLAKGAMPSASSPQTKTVDTLPSYTPGFFITRGNVGTKSSNTISKWEFNTNNFQFSRWVLVWVFFTLVACCGQTASFVVAILCTEEPTDLEGFSHYKLLRIWRFYMVPKCSMYGICTYMYHKFTVVNVGKYSIHRGLMWLEITSWVYLHLIFVSIRSPFGSLWRFGSVFDVVSHIPFWYGTIPDLCIREPRLPTCR